MVCANFAHATQWKCVELNRNVVVKEYLITTQLLTKNISKQLKLDVQKVNAQYGNFTAKQFAQSHDRFLIIDGGGEVYHIGASLKDLGKKWFAFTKMNKESVAGIINVVSDLM